MKILFYLFIFCFCCSCVNDKTNAVDQVEAPSLSEKKKTTSDGKWDLDLEFELEGFNAVGISRWNKYTLISDSALNIIYIVDTRGKAIFDSTEVSSPVYIKQKKSRCLIPSYELDSVFVFRGNANNPLNVFEELDGPTAIDAFNIDYFAILDQKNHRMIYRKRLDQRIIGEEGSGIGQLNFPTNFELLNESKAYILDAGNKRVQVFDVSTGKALFEFGKAENFDWVTGITIDDTRVFVSDLNKGVIYIYDHDGNYIDQINELINNPSEIEMNEGHLYIANQNGPEIIILKEVVQKESED